MKRYSLIVLVILPLLFLSCKNKNSMKYFAHSGQQTLIEVTDNDGQLWKIYSVSLPSVRTISILDKTGQVGVMCLVFADSTQASYAVVFADTALKEKALSVLDKTFMSSVTNSSTEYKNWVNQFGVFSYQRGTKTRTIDLKEGALGSGSIETRGNIIIGRWKNAPCHCYDGVFVCGLSSIGNACVNSLCDLINCIGQGFDSGNISCGDLAAEARLRCGAYTDTLGRSTPPDDKGYVISMTNGTFNLSQ